MNEEEKNTVEELEKQLRLSMNVDDITTTIRNDEAQIILNLINKLQKENEELKESNRKLYEIGQEMCKQDKYTSENYIPVQKVKDKIEEIDEELEIMKVDNMYGRYKEYGGKTKWERLFATKYGMHDALQKLLEGRK